MCICDIQELKRAKDLRVPVCLGPGVAKPTVRTYDLVVVQVLRNRGRGTTKLKCYRVELKLGLKRLNVIADQEAELLGKFDTPHDCCGTCFNSQAENYVIVRKSALGKNLVAKFAEKRIIVATVEEFVKRLDPSGPR